MRCDIPCGMNAMGDRTSGNNKLGKGSGRLFLIGSLKEGLDLDGVDGTVRLDAYGSKGHTDDLKHERVVAWEPGGVPGERADVCGFLKPPSSEPECPDA